MGKISLEVVFGNEHDSRSETLTFEVVRIQSPYHALFGRPAYAKFMARPCYIYLQLKMPSHKGTITVHGSRKSLWIAKRVMRLTLSRFVLQRS